MAARSPTPSPRPDGESCCSSAATSCPARPRTGAPSRSSSTAGTSRKRPGTTPTAQPFQPQVHYFVGGATKLYGAALYRLRPQDFGEIHHVDGVSPAWPLTYDDFEPWYTKAEWLYQVHGNHGEDPTEGPWSKQYPWPAVSPRAAHPGDRRRSWRPPVTTRSRRPAASCSTKPTAPAAPASAARGATATRAWCTPSPTPRRSPSARCSTPPTSRCSSTPRCSASRPTRPVAPSPASSCRAAGAEEVYAADIVVVSAGASNSAKLLLRSANDRAPERARQRLRPGRAQLHVPQLQGHRRAGQGAQRHRVPEDAGDQRLLPRRRRAASGRSATSRWSASPTAAR